MTKEVLTLALETAELHANRLRFAIVQLRQIMPISGQAFSHLSTQNLLLLELFTSRFAKLQDLMGGKIFGLVLDHAKEVGSFNTFLDKLHALEKMELIPQGEKWVQMRVLRNLIAHEYPDDPEKGAKNFNEAFEMAPYLLDCLENIKNFIAKIERY
jgi:hypothetical protein